MTFEQEPMFEEPGDVDKNEGGERAGGFENDPRLDEKLAEIERMAPGDKMEIDLPEGVDYRFFISELGRPDRDFEFSGVCDPKTGSVVIVRGYSPTNRLFDRMHVDSVSPRRDKEGMTDDVFFHTHPHSSSGPIHSRMKPEDFCAASSGDVDSLMALREIEEENGLKRPIVSIVGSNGFISVLETSGIDFNEELLAQSGIDEGQLLKIKQELAIEPPVWTKNMAKNEDSESGLVAAVTDFYHKKSADMSTSYSQKIKELRISVAPYVEPKRLEKFIDDMKMQLPKYPSKPYLNNIGLDDRQVALVHQMTGIKQSIYKVTAGEGMQKMEYAAVT